MSLADDADLWSMIRRIVREELAQAKDGGSRFAEDGIVASGSWNPTDGTVSVWKLETASLLPSDTEQPLLYQGVQLATTVAGHQGPPIGNERCILIRRHSGWLAIMEHGTPAGTPDDSPGAPAGEHWYVHPSTKSFQKFTNAGNVEVSAQAQHSVSAASSTHTVTGTEAHSSENLSMEASETASITAPSVNIGPSGGPYIQVGGSGIGGDLAIVRVSDLSALLTWAAAHVHSGVQGGSSDTAAPTTSPPTITGAPNANAS
jgi:hypothetical protein